jgi:DNA replicative helicase MCM subunit Mcm2 (Cdc46/Mcm family)
MNDMNGFKNQFKKHVIEILQEFHSGIVHDDQVILYFEFINIPWMVIRQCTSVHQLLTLSRHNTNSNNTNIVQINGQVMSVCPVWRRIIRKVYFCKNPKCRNNQSHANNWVYIHYKSGEIIKAIRRDEEAYEEQISKCTSSSAFYENESRCLNCRERMTESVAHRGYEKFQTIKVLLNFDETFGCGVTVQLEHILCGNVQLGDKIKVIGVLKRNLPYESDPQSGYYPNVHEYDLGIFITALDIEIQHECSFESVNFTPNGYFNDVKRGLEASLIASGNSLNKIHVLILTEDLLMAKHLMKQAAKSYQTCGGIQTNKKLAPFKHKGISDKVEIAGALQFAKNGILLVDENDKINGDLFDDTTTIWMIASKTALLK